VNPPPLFIRALWPYFGTGQAVSHTCISICERLGSPGVRVELIYAASNPKMRRPFTVDAIPSMLKGLAFRLDRSGERIKRRAEKFFSRRIEAGDVAYIWPGTSIDAYRAARERGAIVVGERINCHRGTSKRILDDAYRRLRLPPAHGITDEALRDETEKLQLCDFIFSPSPPVTRSLLDAGFPDRVILQSTYGWDPERMSSEGQGLEKVDGVQAVFVGRACVRKGVDLLTSAWMRAKVPGRLSLVGQMDADISAICAEALGSGSVKSIPFLPNVAPVYRSADLFLFPSLEEGSPLVLYEAMASGLASVLSPMAAGEVGRNGVDCLVVDPLDGDGWVEAIRKLAGDPALRRSIGEQARLRAQEFTWEKVGLRRRALFEQHCRRSAVPAAKV